MAGHSFGWALKRAKKEHYVRRMAWRPGKWVRLEPTVGDLLSHLVLEYALTDPKHPGVSVPWTPTRCDLLEEDWVLACG